MNDWRNEAACGAYSLHTSQLVTRYCVYNNKIRIPTSTIFLLTSLSCYGCKTEYFLLCSISISFSSSGIVSGSVHCPGTNYGSGSSTFTTAPNSNTVPNTVPGPSTGTGSITGPSIVSGSVPGPAPGINSGTSPSAVPSARSAPRLKYSVQSAHHWKIKCGENFHFTEGLRHNGESRDLQDWSVGHS